MLLKVNSIQQFHPSVTAFVLQRGNSPAYGIDDHLLLDNVDGGLLRPQLLVFPISAGCTNIKGQRAEKICRLISARARRRGSHNATSVAGDMDACGPTLYGVRCC